MNFGKALESLKDGKKVARTGWNGKGMWLVIFSQSDFTTVHTEPGEKVNLATQGYEHHIGDGGEIDHIGLLGGRDSFYPICDFILMKTADNRSVPWLASQTDILAEDWDELES